MDALVGNMGFSVLPKDTSACGLGKLGVESLTFQLVGDCSFSSRPKRHCKGAIPQNMTECGDLQVLKQYCVKTDAIL